MINYIHIITQIRKSTPEEHHRIMKKKGNIHQRRSCLLGGTWRRLDVTRWPGAVPGTEARQARAERGRTRRHRVPAGRRRGGRDQKARQLAAAAPGPEVLRLRVLALRGGLPLDALAELGGRGLAGKGVVVGGSRWLPGLAEAVLLARGVRGRGELVDDGHLDVAGLALALVALAAARHRALALARQHDAELVAEIVLEVDQTRVRIDVLRAFNVAENLLSFGGMQRFGARRD